MTCRQLTSSKLPLLCLFQNDRQYFRFHFQDASIPFRNLSEVALWRDDGVFTDQRLAGSNPLAIQRVSWNPGNQASDTGDTTCLTNAVFLLYLIIITREHVGYEMTDS